MADCSRAPSPSRTRCEHSVAASAGAARASGAGARTAGAQNFGAHGSSDGVDELEFGEEATARLPCLPEDFLGRQFEMHAVCRALRTRRLVVVSARADTHGRAAGLGTSTVAVAVARYLAVRGVYAHGVSLARCAGIADVGGLSRALRAALLDEDGSAGPAGTGGDAGARLATEREDAAGDGLHWLARVRNRHALVVLDGLDAALVPGCARAGPSSGACEDGVASSSDGDGEGAAVRALLEAVFSQTERLQLVLTLRSHLGPWAVRARARVSRSRFGPRPPRARAPDHAASALTVGSPRARATFLPSRRRRCCRSKPSPYPSDPLRLSTLRASSFGVRRAPRAQRVRAACHTRPSCSVRRLR